MIYIEIGGKLYRTRLLRTDLVPPLHAEPINPMLMEPERLEALKKVMNNIPENKKGYNRTDCLTQIEELKKLAALSVK